MNSELIVIGLSHHTAPVELRERLATGYADIPAELRALVVEAELHEALLLSTCNRVELYAHAAEPQRALERARAHFRERGGGHLINVSSFLGRVPFVPFRSAYSAAKAALNILTSNVRMDLHATHPGIHVSLVMPGPVTTEFALNARGGPPGGTPPPGGAFRPQSAEEVAQAIAGVIEKPVPELYTTPMLADLARRYYEDVGAFEEGHRQTRPAS